MAWTQKLFGDLCNYRCDPDFTVTQLPGSLANVSLICDSSGNVQAVRTNLRGMTSRRGRKSCRRKMIGKRLCSWLEKTLAEDQKYTPEIARIIRDNFLQQNNFTEYYLTCPLTGTIAMSSEHGGSAAFREHFAVWGQGLLLPRDFGGHLPPK